MALREIADDIADFIREDEEFKPISNLKVVVEDKADIATEIQNAIAQTGGMCVMVCTPGFRRRSQTGPLVQGTLDIEIRVYEQPSLNRGVQGAFTAQQVAELLMVLLHYRKLPSIQNWLNFKDFVRQDVDEANIVSVNFDTEFSFGVRASQWRGK